MAQTSTSRARIPSMLDEGITKLYYTISEVANLVEEEQHVLRYWETEFPQLRPRKNRSGKRVYTKDDIDVVFRIRRLLRDEKYTIEGARRSFQKSDPEETPASVEHRSLLQLREFLERLRDRI